MKRMLQYNPRIVRAFKNIIKPFYDSKGVFSIVKYNIFFESGSIARIDSFFEACQNFIINLTLHIYNQEKGLNNWSRYFVDLVILLCSDINIKYRRIMIDSARATVDVSNLDVNEVLQDMKDIHGKFKTEENCVLVVPVDFTLLYNVSDYIILIFNKSKREFDLPHKWEMKTALTTTIKDQKQIKREERQKEVMTDVLKNYNAQLESPIYYTKENYIDNNSKLINKYIKKGSGSITIDSYTTLIISKDQIPKYKNSWLFDLFHEIICGAILPLVFRGVKIDMFEKLMRRKTYIYIEVNKKLFKEFITDLKVFDKLYLDDSIYNSKLVIFDDKFEAKKGTISLANILQLKVHEDQLSSLLQDLNNRLGYSNLRFGDYSIKNHKLKPGILKNKT